MSNRIDTPIVLGSKRYATASNTNLVLQVPLEGNPKEIDEFDRNIRVDLSQVFDDERQESSIFRLTSNIDFVFNNSYPGTTGLNGYAPFTNNLYYINQEFSIGTNSWSGYPQYFEFDLMRLEYEANGCDPNNIPTSAHINFVNKSATTYNWTEYISYVFENDYNKDMQYDLTSTSSLNWKSGDGLPFNINNPLVYNGRDLISFVCPVEHGLSEGEFVKIEFDFGWTGYNGSKIFQIDSLGNNAYKSEKYIFNIVNYSFTGNAFSNGSKGTFKRIIDINNSAETMSKYYVRKHKIITDVDDAILTKSGFERNGFSVKRKYEYSSLTPDNKAKITTKEGSQEYNLTFSKDININLYRDNWNRPLSELFITIVNRGYFGWMNKPIFGNKALREGYEHNLAYFTPPYWSFLNSPLNLSLIQTDSYVINNYTFYYNKVLKSGDIINGDYCEFNQFEQYERVISKYYHKLHYNDSLFHIDSKDPNNPDGYYYQPHHSILLRVYSDYIEDGELENIDSVPNYAFYSEYSNKLIWRDLYTYGFKDTNGNGVSFPFLNGTHYPYSKIIFRLFPEGNVGPDINTIADPLIDECE